MQMMPPPVKPTIKNLQSQPGRVSRRRLIFLATTALIASSFGIALGSTLRFQALSVGQAPLFKPQQDFPPLAEWPPHVPVTSEHEDFNTPWEEESAPPQLVYNEHFAQDIQDYSDYDNVDHATDYYISEDIQPSERSLGLMPTHSDNESVELDATDTDDMAVNTDLYLPSVLTNAENTGGLRSEPDEPTDSGSSPISRQDVRSDEAEVIQDNSVIQDNHDVPWFNEQPASVYPLVDVPVHTSLENTSPEKSRSSPDVLSD